MRLDIQPLELRLKNPFKLSHGTSVVRHNVLVRLHDRGYTGYGEIAVVPYYGHTAHDLMEHLNRPEVTRALEADSRFLVDALDGLPDDLPPPVRAALDMALHDLWGQRLGYPLYRLWGANPARIPPISYTIAMSDDEAEWRDRLLAARGFELVKLKRGSGDWRADLFTVKVARDVLSAGLCVDANGGWSASDALAIIPRLAALGVQYVEQPVARDDFSGWRQLKAALPADHPPLIADESIQGVDSVMPLDGLVDGINIKLAKCGGLRPAHQMIGLARALGLRVLVGCMVETSVAVTAAAHVAALADYADLDGNLLITNDPFRGVGLDDGRLVLPEMAGLGVVPVGQ